MLIRLNLHFSKTFSIKQVIMSFRGVGEPEKCSSKAVQFSCDACVWRSSTNSISVFRPVLPATSVYINHKFFSSVTVENIIGMLALTCTNFYFLQAGCTKLIIPDFMERQGPLLLLVFSAVGTGPESCAADDAGKRFWVFQWEKNVKVGSINNLWMEDRNIRKTLERVQGTFSRRQVHHPLSDRY